jgi:hypothetical protein
MNGVLLVDDALADLGIALEVAEARGPSSRTRITSSRPWA